MSQTAILLGATGLIGSKLATLLVSRYELVLAPVRKMPASPVKGVKYIVTDMNQLSSVKQLMEIQTDIRDLFYCLGTTRQSAGSKERFKEIETALAHSAISAAEAAGVRRFFLLSSQGANPSSRILYLKTKGEIESLVNKGPFETVAIFRPSLLIGERKESRPLEKLVVAAANPLLGYLQTSLPAAAPIRDEQVARALVETATTIGPGRFVLENSRMLARAK